MLVFCNGWALLVPVPVLVPGPVLIPASRGGAQGAPSGHRRGRETLQGSAALHGGTGAARRTPCPGGADACERELHEPAGIGAAPRDVEFIVFTAVSEEIRSREQALQRVQQDRESTCAELEQGWRILLN